MIPNGLCTRLLLLSGCPSLQDDFLRTWSLPPLSHTTNSSLMVTHLVFDGTLLPATAVLDLLDRLRAGYFDLVVILPPQWTGSLQPDPKDGSSQSAAASSGPSSNAQSDPAVSATRAVVSQWELCAWTAEQALAHSSTHLFLWTVEQPGAAQKCFSSTTEFQMLSWIHDARREDSATHRLTSADSCPVAHFLTDIPAVLSPTLGLHSSFLGPECAFPHTSPPHYALASASSFCSILLQAYLSRDSATPLRDRGSGSDRHASTTWSLSQSPFSRSSLYSGWRDGTIDGNILANFSDEPNTTQYFSCTGSQRSPLLDHLVFVSSSGDTASAVFPLWFAVPGSLPARVSVLGQAPDTALAHSSAGDCRKKSCISKGSSREKRLKRDTSCPATHKFGFSLTSAIRKGVSQPSEFAHLDDTVVDRGDTTSTPSVMSRSTGTRIPSTTRAPLAPVELRGDDGDGLRSSLPFSGQTGGVDTRSVSFLSVVLCVF